jgi:DNA-binding XRE family transcriptional regulator
MIYEERSGVKGFLAEMIEERTRANPDFPALVDAALNRRELLRTLAAERRAAGITQTELAAALGTSQAQVARLESGNADAKLSTISRLAAVLGKTIEFTVTDTLPAKRRTRKPSGSKRRPIAARTSTR